jgi:hypothetical protein
MSLSRKQYTSLLADLEKKIEQTEAHLQRLKDQRRVSEFFAELQEIESGQLFVLGQEDSIFSLIESSPTFFKVGDPTEYELQVTRRNGKLLIATSSLQRSFITESELERLTANATWESAPSDPSSAQEVDEVCKVKVMGRDIARAWTYAPETPIVSVANLAQIASQPMTGPQVAFVPQPSSGPQITIMPQQTFTMTAPFPTQFTVGL